MLFKLEHLTAANSEIIADATYLHVHRSRTSSANWPFTHRVQDTLRRRHAGMRSGGESSSTCKNATDYPELRTPSTCCCTPRARLSAGFDALHSSRMLVAADANMPGECLACRYMDVGESRWFNGRASTPT